MGHVHLHRGGLWAVTGVLKATFVSLTSKDQCDKVQDKTSWFRSVTLTERNFVCPKHPEAKQTQTSVLNSCFSWELGHSPM